MLKPEIKQKWLDALRSGKYQQAKETLRTGNDCYCCLGVLCDISSEGEWAATSYDYLYIAGDTTGDDFPPLSVVETILDIEVQDVSHEAIKVSELEDPQGFATAIQKWKPWKLKRILEDRVFVCLALMNDAGASFDAIADVIEQYL